MRRVCAFACELAIAAAIAAGLAAACAAAAGCGSTLVLTGSFPEPQDVGAKDTAAARIGESDAVLLEGAHIFYPRDELSSALIQTIRRDSRVAVVRRFEGTAASPVIVLSAMELDGDRGDTLLRFVRTIGSGAVVVSRRTQEVVVTITNAEEADLAAVGGASDGKAIQGVRRIAPNRWRYIVDFLNPSALLPGLYSTKR